MLKKIIIAAFAVLFFQTFHIVNAYAQESAKENTQESADAKESSGSTGDIIPIPVPVVSSSTVNEGQSPKELTDTEVFTTFFVDDPVRAAAALVKIMDGTPVSEVNSFQDSYCDKISEMVMALDKKSNSGELNENNYRELTEKLGSYGIYTVQAIEMAVIETTQSEIVNEEMGMSMLAIDMLPAPKPGYAARDWPPLPPHSMGPGGHGGHHPPSGTLIPPAEGTSIQLSSSTGKPQFAQSQPEYNPITALVMARIAVRDGDTQEFNETIEAAQQYFPQKNRVHIAAASLYYETGNFGGSERAATNAISINKNDPDAYKARAMARNALKNRQGAIEDINHAVAMNPQDESARLLSLLIESKKTVKTLKTISSLQEMKRSLGIPDDTRYAVKSEPVKIETSKPKSVTPTLDGGVSSDFAKSRAHTKTAQAKNRLGDYESAASYASLALEKDPDNLDAYIERASANNSLGRYDDVVRDTTYVIGKDEGNMQAFNLRAWALNHNNKPAEAENDASRAIGINPNFADAWFNRGLAYEKQGDYKRMLEDFKQAASLNESYNRQYQDALAQYGSRVPGFSSTENKVSDLGGEVAESSRSPMSRFFMLLLFTLVGGALVAVGLTHVFTGQSSSKTKHRQARSVSQPNVLSPSVFYEGVATGKYKIEKKVGAGAMGQVYQAIDKSLGRKVAIKKMNEEIKINEREKRRFLDEARTVALLHHPNIVEIYTIFEEAGDVYLVFEFLDGRTLDRILDKDIRMPFKRVRGIFDEVAKALVYAHGKGVVHRDLKLSNIMLSDEGYVKVMDFGLAGRAIESKVNSKNCEIVGSPAYMAPEQENGNSSIKSDIYALGVCMYETLTGVLPFQGPEFYNQKMRNFYEPVSQSVPGLTKEIDALLEKCLDVDPEKRFASAEEFRMALNKIVF